MAIRMFSDPVRVFLIRSDPVQVNNPVRSDPIRSDPDFANALPKAQRRNLVSREQTVFSMPLQTTFRKHFRKKITSFVSIVGKL